MGSRRCDKLSSSDYKSLDIASKIPSGRKWANRHATFQHWTLFDGVWIQPDAGSREAKNDKKFVPEEWPIIAGHGRMIFPWCARLRIKNQLSWGAEKRRREKKEKKKDLSVCNLFYPFLFAVLVRRIIYLLPTWRWRRVRTKGYKTPQN